MYPTRIDVGVLAARVAFGPVLDAGPVILGQPHQLADYLRRQAAGHLVDELHVTCVRSAGEDLAADRADALLELADHAHLEARRDLLAPVDVARGIHGQEHVAHAFECLGVEILEDHAAFPSGEEVGLARDSKHVGVLEHGPVERPIRHVLAVHRVLAAQALERFVGRTYDVAVRVVQIDGLDDRHLRVPEACAGRRDAAQATCPSTCCRVSSRAAW